MVTQDTAVIPKVNKMKMKKIKKKKSKKKKAKGTENLDSESEADKLDLEQKIYPLSHYISDQEELVNQMFMTIRGSKLEAMLPPVLKSIQLKELKRLCLHELQGMSKKRILCCINGQVMEGSSGSEDEEDEKEEDDKDSKQNEADAKGEKRKPGDDQAPESYLLKKIKVEPGLEDSTGSGEGKSVLELLELEMRARIIKTMLEKGDEGKKITEDAIAAVIQSAKQITKESVDATGGESKEVAGAVAGFKDKPQKKDADREAASDKEAVKERSRGRRRSQGKEADRRRRHYPARDGKIESSRRSRKKGDGSCSDEGSHGKSCKKQNEFNNSKKQVMKRKKITRKEFEERMKRAKKNRTYRQRKSSEDEEKTKENEGKPEEENTKEDSEEKSEDKIDDKKQDVPLEGSNTQDKTEGEASEKEEGEIDSNEEEEGACSPSDISTASRYSSSTSCSKSRSRSYSRSLSRSPYRGRQRKRSRSRSRSRRRRRRRSYSRSYSRSRSPDKRRSRGEYQSRSFERKKSREPPKSNIKKDVKKTTAEDTSPSREEDWGHKCDIEFVDSEEDFDDHPEATKKDSGGQKTLPVNRTERASISFSLQKKPVGIAQSVDLDDLPLKKKQINSMADDAEAIPHVNSAGNEEIVISSDSEMESPVSTQGTSWKHKNVTESKVDGKKQTEKQPSVNSITNSESEGTKNTCISSIKENINSQPGQEKEVAKVCDPETETEAATEGLQQSTEVLSKLTTDPDCEINRQKESNDGTRITRHMKNIDKADSKEDSHTKDSKVSIRSKNNLESTNVDCDDVLEKGNIDTGDSDISHKNPQLENKSELSRIDNTETFSDASEVNSKEKGSDGMCEEKQDDNSGPHTTGTVVKKVGDRGSNGKEKMAKSSSKDFRKSMTGRRVNLKDEANILSVEEGDHTQTEDSVSNKTNGMCSKEKEGEIKDGDSHLCSESVEKIKKDDSLITRKQMEREPNAKEVSSVAGGQSKDFCRGAEKIKLSEDENEEEEIDRKEFCRNKPPVEPIQVETGFIQMRVRPSRKVEMVMPEKSWMKKGKKKREETKDILAMEGVGILKGTLAESTQSFYQENKLETETCQSIGTVEMAENEEILVHSPALVSDAENSQPAQDTGGQKQTSTSPKQERLPEASLSEDKTQRRTDHETEIIGVIETSKDPTDNFDDIELGGSSWSMRWLQSEKVQKVVTSSKMLSRVRKKIQRKEKATKVVTAEKVEETQKPAESVIPVIGSIEEYERLFGTKVKKDEATDAAGSAPQDNAGQGHTPASSSQTHADIPASKDKGNPVFGSDDDGEDSEEEALWSKIIKK